MRVDDLENAVARIIGDATGGRDDAAWTGVEALLGAPPPPAGWLRRSVDYLLGF
jgi:hypothetical protein